MECAAKTSRGWWTAGVAIFLLAGCVALVALREDSVEDLKQRVDSTSVGERPALCIQIAERQLDEANRLYEAGDSAKAQSALGDVAGFAEQARDYSIRAHKREKQTEIAVRKMTRKLMNLKHAVSREDQQQIQEAIDRLERVRDDLLAAMFPKGGRK